MAIMDSRCVFVDDESVRLSGIEFRALAIQIRQKRKELEAAPEAKQGPLQRQLDALLDKWESLITNWGNTEYTSAFGWEDSEASIIDIEEEDDGGE